VIQFNKSVREILERSLDIVGALLIVSSDIVDRNTWFSYVYKTH